MHVRGELPPRVEFKIAVHLAKCPSCRKEEKQLAALDRGLNALEMEPVPEGLSARIMAAIRQREKVEVLTGGGLRVALGPALPGALLLVLLAALAVWVLACFEGGGPGARPAGDVLAGSFAHVLDSLTLVAIHHVWVIAILVVLYAVFDELPLPGLRPRTSGGRPSRA